MHFAPVNNFVVVKKLEGSVKTGSGIILTTSGDSDRAELVAKSELVTAPLAIGDTLLVRWSQALKIDENHFALDAKDVVSKIAD